MLIDSKYISDNNYIAYIPQYFVRQFGIVRNIPKGFTNQFILDEIKISYYRELSYLTSSNEAFKILEIEILKRRVIIEYRTVNYIETVTIGVSFRGQN